MTSGPVSGVVLAAGPSRRFGDHPPKQLALLEGRTLVRRMVAEALASRLSQVIVVVGFAADQVEEELVGLSVEVVRNPRFAAGQSTSVKAGLEAVAPSAAAAMFLPVDQPRLTAALINALIDLQQTTGAPIVVPSHDGERGAPAVVARRVFDELRAIEGDEGGRQLFTSYTSEIVELPLATRAPLEDVDQPGDLARFGD